MKNDLRMNPYRQTVSQETMQAEWLEIQAAQQDSLHFRPLYERYFEPIFRFIHRRTADEHLAADITSQVFLKALQRLENYSFRGVPFSAWLFRIAGNEVAQHYRQAKKNRVVGIDDANLTELLEEMEELDNEKLRILLIQSLDELRDKELEIVELRFFEQRPFKEIAAILNITESNAKVRTYRVLERLKKRILDKV